MSNHGQPAAVSQPPNDSALDELIRQGKTRAALTDVSVLGTVKAARLAMSAHDILDDVRGSVEPGSAQAELT